MLTATSECDASVGAGELRKAVVLSAKPDTSACSASIRRCGLANGKKDACDSKDGLAVCRIEVKKVTRDANCLHSAPKLIRSHHRQVYALTDFCYVLFLVLYLLALGYCYSLSFSVFRQKSKLPLNEQM